jgi:hypothetical protein
MTENRKDLETDIHVIPVFKDEPAHEESVDCWCEPELTYQDEVTDKRVFSHRRPE